MVATAPQPPERSDLPAARDAAAVTFQRGRRPEVLVEVGGDWHSGELRQWARDADGEWWADVTWRRPLGQTFTGTFPRQRVWEDAEDVTPPSD